MQNQLHLEQTIHRIQQMEQIFDKVQLAVTADPQFIHDDGSVKEMIHTLIQYYESGLWLMDYDCDASGQLPPDLKRGVLSQDGLYHFLCEINQYL